MNSRPTIAQQLRKWFVRFCYAAVLLYAVRATEHLFRPEPFNPRVLLLIVFGVWLMVHAWLGVILHELGHLICGLLSGYRFYYFSIGPLHLVRRPDGSFRFGLSSTPGSAGSCCMTSTAADVPFHLSLAGGVILNALTGAAEVALAIGMASRPFVHSLLVIGAADSLLSALMNLLPVGTLSGGSDGYALRLLCRDEAARRDYAIQQLITDGLRRELRSRDMPDEWFVRRPPGEIGNLYAMYLAYNAAGHLFSKGEYREAAAYAGELLDSTVPFQANLRLYLIQTGAMAELLAGEAGPLTRQLTDPEPQRLARIFRTSANTIVCRYARALLWERNEAEADAALIDFEKQAIYSPFPAATIHDRGLLAEIQAAAERLSTKEGVPHEQAG